MTRFTIAAHEEMQMKRPPQSDPSNSRRNRHHPSGMTVRPTDCWSRWRDGNREPVLGRLRIEDACARASGKARRSCSCTDTASRARTCCRSRRLSRRLSPCSHRTCPGTGAVNVRPRRSAFPTSPPHSRAGSTRPGSSVRRSSRTRWAVRSSPSSRCADRNARDRWCSSARRSIRSAVRRAVSSSAGCARYGGNRRSWSRSPRTTTRSSASERCGRPFAPRSPTGSRSACP